MASTAHWLSILEPADIWCADVLSWERLRQTEGYRVLDMEQEILCPAGNPLKTLRRPLHMIMLILFSPLVAIIRREWSDCTPGTKRFISIAIGILVLAVLVIGYGNHLNQAPATH